MALPHKRQVIFSAPRNSNAPLERLIAQSDSNLNASPECNGAWGPQLHRNGFAGDGNDPFDLAAGGSVIEIGIEREKPSQDR